MSVDVLAVIARCTRGGHIQWHHVAKQTGQSIDRVRCLHDPEYMTIRPWPHACEPVSPDGTPEPIDENDTTSPYIKPAPLKHRILGVLAKHTAAAATIATMTGTTLGCAKKELSHLKASCLVTHTLRFPYTWSLTAAGIDQLARTRQGNASERRAA